MRTTCIWFISKTNEPGLAVRGDEDPVSEQEIIYIRVDKNLVNVERVVRPSNFGYGIESKSSSGLESVEL